MPSLACAAASRATSRAPPLADFSSAFYALNPGGDLAETQRAFEAWFRRLPGWEVRGGRRLARGLFY